MDNIFWNNDFSEKEIMKIIKEKKIKFVDLKFTDLIGRWHHLSIPTNTMDKSLFKKGVGVDGSSCPGFTSIESGDINIIPDIKTAFIDSFNDYPTISFICDIIESDTNNPFTRDPRGVAKRAEQFLLNSGIADESYWMPELEFYVFNEVYYNDKPYDTGYGINSYEAHWNADDEEILNWNRYKKGYLSIMPEDSLNNLRAKISIELGKIGIPIRYHHHEVGGAGQCEIEFLISPGLIKTADSIFLAKYIIRNIANADGLSITFMPKPIYKEPGSGMHFHQKLHKEGENIFYDEKNYAHLSDNALSYIAGLFTHNDGVMAFTNPSSNSYRRLVKGYEAPTRLFFSEANRSSAIRIPKSANSKEKKRIEYRMPDATCNPYLAISAMLLAGLNGIQKKLSSKKFGPLDRNIFKLPIKQQEKFPHIPYSFYDALMKLKKDYTFLIQNNVFDKDIIDTWINYKLENEIYPLNSRPHPYEIELYYNL